jgi:hypothetical protein
VARVGADKGDFSAAWPVGVPNALAGRACTTPRVVSPRPCHRPLHMRIDGNPAVSQTILKK